jgi:hypothetical protein
MPEGAVGFRPRFVVIVVVRVEDEVLRANQDVVIVLVVPVAVGVDD